MYKLAIPFLIFSSVTFGQALIGQTEGANITLEDKHYEVIFQTVENRYASFYMSINDNIEDDFSALKKYVFLLFQNKKGDFLLQFKDDSVFLIYKNKKVQMVIWRYHNGDERFSSKWFTYIQCLDLFGEPKERQ